MFRNMIGLSHFWCSGFENENLILLCFCLQMLSDEILKPNNEICFKETRNSYFCVTPKNHRLMFLIKILKSSATKKVIVCFHNLGEENF